MNKGQWWARESEEPAPNPMLSPTQRRDSHGLPNVAPSQGGPGSVLPSTPTYRHLLLAPLAGRQSTCPGNATDHRYQKKTKPQGPESPCGARQRHFQSAPPVPDPKPAPLASDTVPLITALCGHWLAAWETADKHAPQKYKFKGRSQSAPVEIGVGPWGKSGLPPRDADKLEMWTERREFPEG